MAGVFLCLGWGSNPHCPGFESGFSAGWNTEAKTLPTRDRVSKADRLGIEPRKRGVGIRTLRTAADPRREAPDHNFRG